MKPDAMQLILAGALLVILFSMWKAHKSHLTDFNALDILMEGGRVSKIAVGYMLVLGVSTWVIVNQEINGKLTEGMFLAWLGAWVAPIMARIVTAKTPSGEAAP